jgi:aspartate 1-decarboxylase
MMNDDEYSTNRPKVLLMSAENRIDKLIRYEPSTR